MRTRHLALVALLAVVVPTAASASVGARREGRRADAGAMARIPTGEYRPLYARSAVRAGLTARTTLGGLGFRCAANVPV